MAPLVAGGRSVALVVEDEFLIAMDAVDILTRLGYETIEAASADIAVMMLNRRSDISLVFTDIDMPGSMSGLDLSSHIDLVWPHIEILITSGRLLPAAMQMPGKSRFLTRPYQHHQVAMALASIRA